MGERQAVGTKQADTSLRTDLLLCILPRPGMGTPKQSADPHSATSQAIPKLRTFTPTTGGSATSPDAAMPIIISTILGNTDASLEELDADTYGASAEDVQIASFSADSFSAWHPMTTVTAVTGIGMRTRSCSTTTLITMAGTLPTTYASEPTSTCSISATHSLRKNA
jgi:hypothetical protein